MNNFFFFSVASFFFARLVLDWRADSLLLPQRCFWTLILLFTFLMPSSSDLSVMFSFSSFLTLALNLAWHTVFFRLLLGGWAEGRLWLIVDRIEGLGMGDREGEPCTGEPWTSPSGDGGVMSKIAARSFFFFLFFAFVCLHSSRRFSFFCFGRQFIFLGGISPLAFFSWYLLIKQRQLLHSFYTKCTF